MKELTLQEKLHSFTVQDLQFTKRIELVSYFRIFYIFTFDANNRSIEVHF